jgi:hypothetical protein
MAWRSRHAFYCEVCFLRAEKTERRMAHRARGTHGYPPYRLCCIRLPDDLPGQFQEQILPERLESISLSFLVESMSKQRGGIAPEHRLQMASARRAPRVMATVGEDFEEYRAWLDAKGVDTSLMKVIPGVFTASFFATTDQASAQIASFYPGAMGLFRGPVPQGTALETGPGHGLPVRRMR